MDKFRKSFLKEKKVSVWGVGYLGYTEILRLQFSGIKARVIDFTNTGFNKHDLHSGYPTKEQLYCWSENIGVPKLDLEKIEMADAKSIFDSKIHILAFPLVDKNRKNLLNDLLELFLKNKNKIQDALIILLSCSKPGFVEGNFIEVLKKNKVHCGVVSAFRSDWTIDEFLLKDKSIVLASNDLNALKKAEIFYKLMHTKACILKSINEAELYENAKNVLQHLITTFVNELSFAYPKINIRNIAKLLLKHIELNDSHLCIGAGGYKTLSSLQNILEASKNPNSLSLLKASQESNLNMILQYAETIKSHNCKSVTILGISVKGNLKSTELSPSVILAESLYRLGIKIFVDDPLFSKDALSKILPFANVIDISKEKINSDCLILMVAHNKYKFLSQEELNKIILRNVSLIVDNIGLFADIKFQRNTKYILIGAGERE